MDYEDAHLPAELVTDLEACEASHDNDLNDEMEWRSGDLAKAYAAEGEALAHRVAEAVGSAFVLDGDGGKVRSDGPPTSPAAAEAFTALAEVQEAEYNKRPRIVADGAELCWSPDQTRTMTEPSRPTPIDAAESVHHSPAGGADRWTTR